jgi:hypothetical protein
MKKTFSKFLATAAAVSMLASVSAVVNADPTFETTAVTSWTSDAGEKCTIATDGFLNFLLRCLKTYSEIH